MSDFITVRESLAKRNTYNTAILYLLCVQFNNFQRILTLHSLKILHYDINILFNNSIHHHMRIDNRIHWPDLPKARFMHLSGYKSESVS